MEMRKREAGAEEALSRYRNALVAGASPDELAMLAEPLDPAIVQTLHQMRTGRRGNLAGPRPDFADGLEHDLLAAFGRTSASSDSVPLSVAPHMSPNGHTSDVASHRPPTQPDIARWRWTTTHLAMAAALLLALIGGAFLARTLLPSGTTTVLNAAHEPIVETLVDSPIEGAPESWTPMTVEHWTFQPGPATLTIPALDGPQWLVADSGPAVMTVDGVAQTTPAGSGVVIPAGTELVMSNPGTEVLSVYRGVAASGYALEEYDRGAITKQTALDTAAHEALPPGTSRVVFERLTLFPGTTLLLEPASGQDWLDIASGNLGVTLLGDGLPLNWQSGREREIAEGESLPAMVPGTRVSLRNIGEDPLVLLRLRVIPRAATSEPEPDMPLNAGAVPVAEAASDRLERAE